MPYVTSWPDNTFLAEFSGAVDPAEIEAVNYLFSGDERLDRVRWSIWDFSRVTHLTMPPSELEDAAAFDKGVATIRRSLRGALIVPDPPMRQVVDAYLAIAAELEVGWDTRAFASMAEARAWLEGGT